MKRTWALALATMPLLTGLGILHAVQSVNVEQTSTADFQDGTFEDVVVNNLGELKLAHKLDTILKADKDVVFVNALATDDKGNVYAATAPNGKLFRIGRDGKCELYYTAKEKTLQSLAIGPKNELYVGTGGGDGKILRVPAKDKAEVVLEKSGLAYVWAMAVLPDGRIVAGTGPHAELILVAPNDKPSAGEVLFKPEKDKQKNILSVAADRGQTVYFGTDTDGLVFKYDLQARRTFLLYDANEAEISCLALAADGVLYAGTSDPRQGAEGEHAPSEPSGRPGGPPVHTRPAGPGDDGAGDEEAAVPEREGEVEAVEISAGGEGDDEHYVLDDESPDTVMPGREGAPSPSSARKFLPGAAGRAASAPTTRPDGAKPAAAPAKTGKPPASQPEKAGPPKATPKDGPPPGLPTRPREGMVGRPGRPGGPESGGNAIYRIDARGFVTEVLRQPTLILGLLLQDSRLIVATGSEGRVLAVTPGSEEIATLAKPKDVKQVLALAPGSDGAILIGTANEAVIARIGAGYSPRGTFTSKPIDAKNISHWGVIREKSTLPAGCSVQVQTRSGNLAEPDDALWSPWSGPVKAAEPVTVSSPVARFIQYRVVLATDREGVTPAVDSVTASYANENQPPKIASARAIAPGGGRGGADGESRGPGPGPSRMPPGMIRPGGPRPGGDGEGAAGGGMVMLTWDAADPNEDTLEYTLAFRRAGTTAWVPMTEKPIRENKFPWPTRGVPDGQYQVRVVVSDLPDNPPAVARSDSRITDLFTVDNTPPVISNFRLVEQKGPKVTLAADLNDALSTLASASAKTSLATEEQSLQPADGIWDQRNESLRFTMDLTDRQAGTYLLSLTANDSAGNATTAALEVARP